MMAETLVHVLTEASVFVKLLRLVCSWLSSPCVLSGPEPKPEFKGDTRTYRVQLDCNQYQKDMMDIVKGHEVSYTDTRA